MLGAQARILHNLRIRNFTLRIATQGNLVKKLSGVRRMADGTGQVKAGVITTIDTSGYDAQLASKKELIQTQFAEFRCPKLEVFRSSPEHYRMR